MASVGRKSGLFTIAGYAAIVSGVTGVAMVATLIVMYGLFALGEGARETALKYSPAWPNRRFGSVRGAILGGSRSLRRGVV